MNEGKSTAWLAQAEIELSSRQRAFSRSGLKALRDLVAPKVGMTQFVSRLLREKMLNEVHLRSPYEKVVRFTTGSATGFDLALSIKRNTYLCHSSAMAIHGIASSHSSSSIIFVNKEQTPKPQSTSLSQEAIDNAFLRKQRYSTNLYKCDAGRFLLLNGKHTGQNGVELRDGLRVTNLERTLIDITVRPEYAGGVRAILQAFSAAIERLSLPNLCQALSKMEFSYPYSQAIGFFLERAGLPRAQLETLKSQASSFRFYIGYGKMRRSFDEYWCVHYPKELD